MVSVNTNNSIQNRTPGFGFNFESSLGNMLNSGSTIDTLFASLLQSQAAPPPPNGSPQSSSNAQVSSPNSDAVDSDSSNQPNNSPVANNANPPVNNSNANSSGTPVSKTSGWTSVGKTAPRQAKTNNTDNNNSNTTTGASQSSQQQPPVSTANNGPASAPSNASSTNADNSPASTAGATDQNDPNGQNDPNDPVINEIVNLLNSLSGSSGNSGQANGDALSSLQALLAKLNSTASDGTTSADDSSTDPTSSPLMMLLAELQHLSASQLAALMPSTSGLAATGQTSGTSTTAAAPQDKLDLKGLLSAIAQLDQGTSTDPTLTDNVNLASSTAAATTPQTATPASANTTAADTDNKLLSSDFLNLFAAPTTNTNAPATLPVFNPGIVTSTMIDSDGDAALDTDAQGQGNTGPRDGTASLLPDANSLLPAAGTTQAASPYDFASQLSALRATQGGATGLPTPIDQVVLQLSRSLTKDGSSQMTIQLRPAELGRVDVKLSIDSDGKVQGTVTADNPSTLNLLLKDVRGLERALQEAGLRADSGSLQFGLRGDGQPGNSGQTASNQSGFNDASDAQDQTMLPAFNSPAETYYLTPGGVNMRV